MFDWGSLFFWIFAAGAIVSSVAVIRFRNPLYSALSLVLDFFCFAGLYVLLSAHFIAVTQVLVYTGAIMVLFLFIIMLLNLKDDELEQFDFRVHHLLAIAASVGLLVLVTSAIKPLVNMEAVKRGQDSAVKQYKLDQKKYETILAAQEKTLKPLDEAVEKAQALVTSTKEAYDKSYVSLGAAPGDEAAKKAMVDSKAAYEAAYKAHTKAYNSKDEYIQSVHAARPKKFVQTPTAVKGLYADLSEAGLNKVYQSKIDSYVSGRSTPATGKYPRYDKTVPMPMPPAMTGVAMSNEHGNVRASGPAVFGTIKPISVLIVNRFVVPFELTAILLLAAIVGGVIIAKRRL